MQQVKMILLLKKVRAMLVLPVALFIGAIGWSLMWIDSEKSSSKNVKTAVKDREESDAVSFQLAQEPVDLNSDGVPQAQ